MLKQVFIGIIFMSLDGVPLIAVLNTLSGFHFSLTRFSITVIINIIKEATQNPVLLPFGSIPNVWELFFYSYRAKMEYRLALISSVVCYIIIKQSRFGRWADGAHCASWHLLQ